MIAPDAEVDGLDPYDLLDAETARVATHATSLSADGWAAPSRCGGWTVQDVLAHLAGSEAYNHACLEGTLEAFLAGLARHGVRGMDDFNERSVRARAGRLPAEVLAEWEATTRRTTQGLREADGGTVPTMVGPYPVRRQAFHLLAELATHADDMAVPVHADEEPARTAWRARVARFLLREGRPQVALEPADDGVRVAFEGHEALLEDRTLVEAVAGRLSEGPPLDGELRRALCTT